MKERVAVFGPQRGLVGIVCEPDVRRDGPAVLFSNVGLNHRVGPNRLWVDLARRLADEGFTSLRFDLSGLGDSEARADALSDHERAVLDTQDALAYLAEKHGASRFVLVANCSGVDPLHAVALTDPRVVGAVPMDGYCYRNRGYALRHWTLRFLEPRRWLRLLRRRRHEGRRARREAGEAQEVWVRDIPTRDEFARDLGRLVTRGVRLLFVFTSGVDERYNHAGQFHDTFGYRDGVEVLYDPRADHLFSGERERTAVREATVEWMTRHFSRGRP